MVLETLPLGKLVRSTSLARHPREQLPATSCDLAYRTHELAGALGWTPARPTVRAVFRETVEGGHPVRNLVRPTRRAPAPALGTKTGIALYESDRESVESHCADGAHRILSEGLNVSGKLGFICGTCQTRLQVARTVNPCTGRVVRYRKCPKCGRNVVTEERVRAEKLSISNTYGS